ncbi:unnamed protein product [Sympodiomycopsis kandeliae]
MIDPFKADDESETGDHPPSQPHGDTQQIDDPFVGEHHASTSNLNIKPHPRSPAATPATVPAAVDAASASLMLSASGDAHEQHQDTSTDARQAVRLGKMKEVDDQVKLSPSDSYDDEENEATDQEESAPMIGNNAKQSVSKPPSSKRNTKRSSRNTSGSVATLAALGRSISRTAKTLQDQDDVQRGGGIRLQQSRAEQAAGKTPSNAHLNRRERALWMWANVEQLDEFLNEVYAYYTGKGFQCVAIRRLLNLLTVGFVISFSTFLAGCIDYSKIRHDGRLADAIDPQFSTTGTMALIAFVATYMFQLYRFATGLRRLRTMQLFFEELLEIPQDDIETIPWHQVVARLAKVGELHPIPVLSSDQDGQESTPASLDVHQVANRLMRQDNYLIALFNRNLLDLRIPFLPLQDDDSSTSFLTKSLQWNLNFCLLGFLFDHRGNVRKQFLHEKYRQDLISGLERRFIFTAIVNAVLAPFIVLYILIYSFFRYFEEYHKNPAILGSRQYTELARWKFREYNEVPHLFRKRCHASYPFASKYIDQFPKERKALFARFVAFIAGSFTAVLVLASVLDPDVFVHFEITRHGNVLFYIGIFGAILAGARSMIPDERMVFEPELLLEAVNRYTHYSPDHWKGRFHSREVHAEFGKLYSLKVSIFIIEVLSVLVTPFILWLSLPKNAPAIIDFFRECTVHVEGLGYVCSFAVFDSARQDRLKSESQPANSNAEGLTSSAPEPDSGSGRSISRDYKLENSVLNFALTNDWRPEDMTTSLYLEKLQRQHFDSERSHAQLAPQHQHHHHALSPEASLTARSRFYDEALERSLAQSRINQQKRHLAHQQIRAGKPKRKGRDLHAVQEDQSGSDQGPADPSTISEEDIRAGFVGHTGRTGQVGNATGSSDPGKVGSRPKSLMEHVNSLL